VRELGFEGAGVRRGGVNQRPIKRVERLRLFVEVLRNPGEFGIEPDTEHGIHFPPCSRQLSVK